MVDKEEAKTPSPVNIKEAIEEEVLNEKTARILKNDLLLHEAVIKNEADAVRKVLKETVDVDSRNNYGRAPIHWAASRGNTEIIEMLIQAKCDIEARDKFGMRPLHMAAWHGHRDAVKMLINTGASVSAVNKKQYTLLMCAARGNNVGVVEYLAEAVESLNGDATDCTGASALHHAASAGHPSVITALCNIPKIQLNAIDKMGFTPLHVAASQGCKGILDSMIQHGAALNKQCKYGNTPLHLACQNNEVETVEILINKGVDLNCLNSRLQSPIHIAAEMGHTDICELLLAAGANIEQREQSGKTPLYIAARGSFTAIVDMIIKTARLDYPTPEAATSDKENRDLTPARRRWREGSRGGSISSNNGGLPEHIRSVLWKLAYKYLGPEDWKKLALHWAFTHDQIRAIEHQYTAPIIGPSSYKEHGFRMLMIWASGLNSEVPITKELCDALSAIDKKAIVENILKQLDQEKEGKPKASKRRCHKCSIT
ncbi:uncharacterized protein LOC143183117 isoform X4 [Calliopsis andreniformis]|uniref:uncharacterized protein LOC143183117 isoform X4 n=1 Tax=Calliopsis andreniformis TaxID=337506 RepID=UPI003FCDE6E9